MMSRKNELSLYAGARELTLKIGLAAFMVLAVAACGSVPRISWPTEESAKGPSGLMTAELFLEMQSAQMFIDQQIASARRQPADGSVRKELVEAAEKSHQPILAKRMTYSPPVISAVVEDVALLNPANAIVTFQVKSGYPAGYPIVNNSAFTYVYALYKQDGVWKAIATYQLRRASVVS